MNDFFVAFIGLSVRSGLVKGDVVFISYNKYLLEIRRGVEA